MSIDCKEHNSPVTHICSCHQKLLCKDCNITQHEHTFDATNHILEFITLSECNYLYIKLNKIKESISQSIEEANKIITNKKDTISKQLIEQFPFLTQDNEHIQCLYKIDTMESINISFKRSSKFIKNSGKEFVNLLGKLDSKIKFHCTPTPVPSKPVPVHPPVNNDFAWCDISKMTCEMLAPNIAKVTTKCEPPETFIVKTMKDAFKLDVESNALRAFESINAKNNVKAVAKDFISKKQIAIEYAGETINTCKYNDTILLDNIADSFYNIMKELGDVKLFHSDISPSNISMNPNKKLMLFDYDVSIPNAGIDKEKVVKLNGMKCIYAAPELLYEMLNSETGIKINPYRCDLYSLGKSLICWMLGSISNDDILRNLYGLKFDSRVHIQPNMSSSLTKEEKSYLDKQTQINDFQDKLYSLYFISKNDELVKNAAQIVASNKQFQASKRHQMFMELLIRCIKTKSSDRPSLQELNEEITNIRNNK